MVPPERSFLPSLAGVMTADPIPSLVRGLALLLACGAGALSADDKPISKDSFAGFLETHCVECHSGDQPEGKLDLAKLSPTISDREQEEHWVRVFDRVTNGEMPPKEAAK